MSFIDSVFPPHRDAHDAHAVTEEVALRKMHLVFHKESKTYTALSYRDPAVRALMRANKFHHDTHASIVLGAVLFEMLAGLNDIHALDLRWKDPIIIPIPSSKKTYRERGGNQVEWILETLPKEALGTYYKRILQRSARKSQTHVRRSERIKNIREAFYVSDAFRELVADRSIFLIDDVSESGATMKDAMRALKEAGAKHVIGIALAK